MLKEKPGAMLRFYHHIMRFRWPGRCIQMQMIPAIDLLHALMVPAPEILFQPNKFAKRFPNQSGAFNRFANDKYSLQVHKKSTSILSPNPIVCFAGALPALTGSPTDKVFLLTVFCNKLSDIIKWR